MTVATETAGLPVGWSQKPLSGVVQSIRETATLAADQAYELWSIPSFSNGLPERVVGSEIGSAKLAVSPSDVLISKINPRINRVWMVAEPPEGYIQVASTEWIVARIDESTPLLPRFLRWYATSPAFRALIESGVQGVTGSHTRAKTPQVLKLPVPVPPLPEQQRIVEILEEQLSRLDAALDSVRVVREKAAQFRRSLLHAAFTGALTGRIPGSDGVPMGWDVRRLGDVATITTGSTPSTKKPHYYGDDIPFVKPAELTGGAIVEIGQHLSLEGANSARLVGGNALLTCCIGTIGKVGMTTRPCAFNQQMNAAEFTGEMNPWFALHYVSSQEAWLRSKSTGVTLSQINKRNFSSLPIPVPPPAEQQRIVDILEEQLSRLNASLAVADTIEKRSAALRRSLLHAAFTGRLTEQWREHGNV